MSASPPPRHLLTMTLDEFTDWCVSQGMPGFRARQVFEWVYDKGVADFGAMTNLAKDLRRQLAREWVVLSSEIAGRQVSSDGTTKLLLRWPDGATSECVMIPDGRRRTGCISSQVGCPVGCTFCASGLQGLERQLTAGEIVEQVWRLHELLRAASGGDGDDRLSNLVFMGLGEPLANFGAVTKAVRILNADWGVNLGARRITISTIGLPNQIRKLAKLDLQINLAISLHAPNDRLRRELIPWAERIRIDELIDAGRYYFDTTGREVTLEYVLLGGVNDRLEHANDLVRVCRKMRCNVNLLRYNPVPSLPYARPDGSDTYHFVSRLRERGVNAHVRKSRGMDIDAACGQLRRRHQGTQRVQLEPSAEENISQ